MTSLNKHTPTKFSVLFDKARQEVKRIAKKNRIVFSGPLYDDIVRDAQEEAIKWHLARLDKCPIDSFKTEHDNDCRCHWCTHDEVYDKNPQDCPQCQEPVWVFIATSDWSKISFVSETLEDLMSGLNADFQNMLETPDLGGSIVVSLKKYTDLEWWTYVLDSPEFCGFE